MEVPKGSTGIGETFMAIRIYSGDYGKATQSAVPLTLSLRAGRAESKEKR